MKLSAWWVVGGLTIIGGAANAKPLKVTVGADGAVRAAVPRNLVDGEPKVKVAFSAPGWRLYTQIPSEYEVKLVPKGEKYDRPMITVNVQVDNLEPGELADYVTKSLFAQAKPIVGGGTLVKIMTDKRKLELADHAHAIVSTVEVDATADRQVHYVETKCFAWRDGDGYAIQLDGFAEIEDAKRTVEFEQACESITFPK